MFKPDKLRKISTALILLFAIMFTLSGCFLQSKDEKIPVQVLIIPKFEVGENAGDFPGEAQYFYEGYLDGGDVFEIDCMPEGTLQG